MSDLESILDGATLPTPSRVIPAPQSAASTAYLAARLDVQFQFQPGKYFVLPLTQQVAEELRGIIDLWLESR
jgi:hypothetical protein